jgi:hypothetical protein
MNTGVSPPDRQVRPKINDLGTQMTTGRVETRVSDVAAQLRRRRAAAWRLVPLSDGHRDPLDGFASPPGPSDFGLNRADLVTEIRRCREAGWVDWELVVRFTDPRRVA